MKKFKWMLLWIWMFQKKSSTRLLNLKRRKKHNKKSDYTLLFKILHYAGFFLWFVEMVYIMGSNEQLGGKAATQLINRMSFIYMLHNSVTDFVCFCHISHLFWICTFLSFCSSIFKKKEKYPKKEKSMLPMRICMNFSAQIFRHKTWKFASKIQQFYTNTSNFVAVMRFMRIQAKAC